MVIKKKKKKVNVCKSPSLALVVDVCWLLLRDKLSRQAGRQGVVGLI
jgi:hypothetical protein